MAPDEPEIRSYRAFLSYSHKDDAFVRRLHRKLETFRVPRGVGARRHLRPVFRDREELPASADLGAKLREALARSEALVVVCSREAAASKWVGAEIESFQALGRADRILAVLAPSCPSPPCFPPALRASPIAADARPTGDGLHGALLKLVAGILGLDLDALVQRDRARRRRARWALGLTALALAVGAWLGWHAIERRKEREKGEAVVREQAREAARRGYADAREAALRGDAAAMALAIAPTLALEPERWEARFLSSVAQRRLAGLVAPPLDVGEEVREVVHSPAGTHALVHGDRTGRLALVDWERNAVLRDLAPSPGAQDGLAARFSPDGRQLVLIDDQRLRLHDVAKGAERTLAAPPGSRAAFLGDGRLLVATSVDGRAGDLVVLSMPEVAEQRRFSLGDGEPGDVEGSRVGTSAVVWWWRKDGGESRAVATWIDAAVGTTLAELARDANRSSGGGLNAQGSHLLVPVEGGAWEVWTRSGSAWTVEADDVVGLGRWSDGGGYALVDVDGPTSVRDAASGAERWAGLAGACATDASDRWCADSDDEGVVRVRSLATGRPETTFLDRIGWPDPGDFPDDDALAFSPDGEELLVAGAGRLVKRWRWRQTSPEVRWLRETQPDEVRAAALADADTLVLLDARPRLVRVDLASGAAVDLAFDAAAEDGVWSLAGAGGRWALGTKRPAGDPPAATLWSATAAPRSDGRAVPPLASLPLDRVVLEGPLGTVTQAPQYVRVVADERHVVTLGLDSGWVRFWRTTDGAPAGSARISDPTPSIQPPDEPGRPRAALSSDGRVLAVAGLDGHLHVVSVPDGRRLAKLPHPGPLLTHTALSPDGRHAVSADPEHLVLWDVARGTSTTLLGPEDPIANETHFVGDVLAAALSDGVVRLWPLAHPDRPLLLEPRVLPGEEAGDLGPGFDPALGAPRLGLVALARDPSGRWLAALSDKGALFLWALPSGDQLMRWRLPSDRAARLLVAPSGSPLAVVGGHGEVTRIDVEPAPPDGP